MAKDIKKKTRGTWWYGWVKYSCYNPFDKSQSEYTRTTDWEFATAGQAQRAAEALAGALTSPTPVYKGAGRFQKSKNDKSLQSRITVIEIGASKAK